MKITNSGNAEVCGLIITKVHKELSVNYKRIKTVKVKRCGHLCFAYLNYLYAPFTDDMEYRNERCCICEVNPKTHPKGVGFFACPICKERKHV